MASMKSKNETNGRVVLYMILVIYAVITLFPFLWTVSSSFKSYQEITSGSLSLIPKEPTLDAYKKLIFSNENFVQWIKNSFIIATTITVFNVLFNSMAGYALAKIEFKGRNLMFMLILFVIMVPGQVLLIPNYLIIKNLGMLDSYSAVIVPSTVTATYIFMMRQFYINFPSEVEEAAKVDGLGRLGIFFRISLPLAKPSIATQAIFIFLGAWNEFLKSKLYLSSPSKYTLTVGIQTMMSQYSGISQWDQVMAASVISLVPILILYIVLNKYFMEGVRMDGEK